MPNNVMNIVKMKGIGKIPLFTISDGEWQEKGAKLFDFNKLIPMPESLNIKSSSINHDAIVYFATNRCTLPLRSISNEYQEIVGKLFDSQLLPPCYADEIFMRNLEKTYGMNETDKEDFYRLGET